jgi:hypothetical protein
VVTALQSGLQSGTGKLMSDMYPAWRLWVNPVGRFMRFLRYRALVCLGR